MQEKVVMLSIKETAERSGLSQHAIRQWLKQGKLAHVKAGRNYWINWEVFVEFLTVGEKEEESIQPKKVRRIG